MRLRNIPRAETVLRESIYVIKDETQYKGSWNQAFPTTQPIHLEIGMGKGQFLLALAAQNPDVNYVGIERYSSVLLRAVEKLESLDAEKRPQNIRFLCMDASDITEVFAPGEVSRIYLNFSDPWPKARHARRRLTSAEYLHRYDQILIPDGQIEFKTDNRSLFDFSLEQIEESEVWRLAAHTFDLHQDASMNVGNVMTEYEEKFSSMNNPINKLIARRQSG